MKLWLLRPQNERDDRWDWDCAYGFVVRAATEDHARRYAAGQAGDEGEDTWMSQAVTTCEELTQDGDPGVVLQDFNAG